MQPSEETSADIQIESSSGQTSPLKRKSELSPSPENRQTTISELLKFSTPRPDSINSHASGISPPPKRYKSASSTGFGGQPFSARTVPAMFKSGQGPPSNFIDLTRSSPPSGKTKNVESGGSGPVRAALFHPRGSVQKLEIRNFRNVPRVKSEEYAKDTWIKLDAAITAIFSGEKVSSSLEELYRGVENICRQDGARALAKKLRRRCDMHVQDAIATSTVSSIESVDSSLEKLRLVYGAWTRWQRELLAIQSIFYFLDRSYLMSQHSEPEIRSMGVHYFCKYLADKDDIQFGIVEGMCDLADAERRQDSGVMDSALLTQSVRMVQDLSKYSTPFEPHFVRKSEEFFDAWATEESSKLKLAEYVRECQTMETQEAERYERWGLLSSTTRQLQTKLEAALINRKADLFTDFESLSKLWDENNTDTVEAIYKFLLRVKQPLLLKEAWTTYIKERGSQIVEDEKRVEEMIPRLLEYKARLDNFWRTSFHKREEIGHALRESFASFINERKPGTDFSNTSGKPGEMVAKYADALLRGGIKAIPPALLTLQGKKLPSALSSIGSGKSFGDDAQDVEMTGGDEDAELAHQLEQVLDLFRFIEGKDVFEAFYKKDLARRLLMGRSASADAERMMLAKLRNECGAGFTHNLEQMFKDVDLGKEEMTSYKNQMSERRRSDRVELFVNVLSASAWPTYPDVRVIIPPEIASSLESYEAHYKLQHTGRRLTWKHALAHCNLKAQFPQGNKELVVSSFQAIALMQFNGVPDNGQVTYEDLKSATGLSDPELKRTLQSLACAKYRVLTKIPKGRDVKETDAFSVNLGFSNDFYRIKINQIQLKETKQEVKKTHEDINRDRQYETQAAIIRIMKTRKTITHNELIAETVEMTKKRGRMDFNDIKKQIEKLIEKDYMERDMNVEGQVYTYLA